MRILGIGNPFLDRIAHVDSLPQNLKKGDTHVAFNKEDVENCWKSVYGEGAYQWTLGGSCTNVIKVLRHILSKPEYEFSLWER